MIRSYRDLTVWQSAMELAKIAYAWTSKFPKQEVYGITSQIQRAAVSVPANIAEGRARNSTKEFLHHLSIARGSLAELETLLSLAETFDYCRQGEVAPLFRHCDEISRMLSGLRKRLKLRIDPNP
jgi:four helix bundle protein